MKTINIYVCIATTLFLMFLSVLRPSVVYASEKEICKINIECNRQDMKWFLYRIGDASEDRSIVYDEAFKKYSLPEGPVSYGEIQNLALTFEKYIKMSGNPPKQSGVTDESGYLSFTVDEGWYIVISESLITNDKVYTSTPLIVCVSTLEIYSETWGTEVTAFPKIYESQKDSPELIITVTSSSVKDNIDSNNDSIVSDKENNVSEMLPQTGQLWWPVPLLTISGIIFFSFGYIIEKRR